MILKADSRGRVRTPPERREALLEEFERSGLPATKFSAMVGVRCQTFATWVQRRRRGSKTPTQNGSEVRKEPSGVPVPALRLVEAVREDEAEAGVRVELPGGAWMRMGQCDQAQLVAALLKALESSPARSC